jgi:hypothetical protein
MSHYAKPWHRKGRGWYVELDDRQIKLGDDRQEAFDRYHQMMAGQSPAAIQVAEVMDWFLGWCLLNRSYETYIWHRKRCQSFRDFLKNKNLLTIDALKPCHLDDSVAEHASWNAGMRRGAMVSIQRAFNWATKRVVDRLDRFQLP